MKLGLLWSKKMYIHYCSYTCHTHQHRVCLSGLTKPWKIPPYKQPCPPKSASLPYVPFMIPPSLSFVCPHVVRILGAFWGMVWIWLTTDQLCSSSLRSSSYPGAGVCDHQLDVSLCPLCLRAHQTNKCEQLNGGLVVNRLRASFPGNSLTWEWDSLFSCHSIQMVTLYSLKISYLWSMINSDQQWSMMISNDQQWSAMINDDLQWSTMISNDQWWSVMINNDQQWSMMISNDQQWSMINNDQ